MLNHVVIWQGEREQAELFTAGVEANRFNAPLVVCQPRDRESFGQLECFDLPGDAADSEAWRQVLLETHVAVAKAAPAHAEPGAIVLNLVVSASRVKDARQMLAAMIDGASHVPGKGFAVHIVLLLDTISPFAGEQAVLLASLQADAAEDGADVAKAARLQWNRLSVLSDWSYKGAASPEIAYTRKDILSGLIAGTDEGVTEALYDCAAYGVQRTSFRRNDVRLLPRHMLYHEIFSHQVSSDDVRRALMPSLDDMKKELENELAGRQFPLAAALLADDNNYRERTGEELVDSFLKRNARMLSSVLETDRWADRWLLNGKKQLAAWLDCCKTIGAYLQPGGGLERDLNAAIDALRQNPPPYGRGTVFGSQTPLRKRWAYARCVEAELYELLIWQGQLRCLEAALSRLPQLNEYLGRIRQANERYFEGGLPDLVDAFSDTPWGRAIAEVLKKFHMRSFVMADRDVERYDAWLERTLKEWFFDQIKTFEFIHAEADFIKLAGSYVGQDLHSFVMINQAFGPLEETAQAIECLGASTRLYRLTVYHWDVGKVCPGDAATTAALKVEPEAAPAPAADEGPVHRHICIDMKAKLTQEEDHYILQWHWPKDMWSLQLTVTGSGGETCYSVKVDRPLLTSKGCEQIPLSSLPQGGTVWIRLEDRTGRYTELSETVPRVEELLELQAAGGVTAVLKLPARLQRWSVHIPGEISRGIPASRCVLELERQGQIFRYPIPQGEKKMIILSETDKAWQCVRMVLEEN